MSIPRNHHYVSRCHIEHFYNGEEKKIFVYDKEFDNFFYKESTKTLFSEKDSNSFVDNGEINHIYLEEDLKIYEDYFNEYVDILNQIIDDPRNLPENYEFALIELIKYGIAGYLRHPETKKRIDDTIDNALYNMIMPHASPELENKLKLQQEIRNMTKHSNLIDYTYFADEVIGKMGNVIVNLYYITTDDFFILPDRYSRIMRAKINNYFNPDIKEIAFVATPITSKIFLVAWSSKLRDGRNGTQIISDFNRELVFEINKDLYHTSHKQIACENELYLRRLVEKIQNQR